MTNNRRINSIDIVRLFAAILVVAIHTRAITWLSGYPNGNIQILVRIAVPFFFCTSGYFLYRNYANKGFNAITISLWKIIRLYAVLSLIYFAVIFISNPSLLHESKKWIPVDFLFNGSYYHLWYMVGVIYSIAIIGVFCKLKLTKALLPISVVCYVIGLLGTSYYCIGSKLPILNVLFDSGWFLSIRRIFLMGFPFTVLGWTIAEGNLKLRLSHGQLMLTTGMTALLFVGEIIMVTVTGISNNVVITVFLYPLLFLLFQICLAHPLPNKKSFASACRDMANFTYFWHPLVILLLDKYIYIYISIYQFALFVATSAICLLLGSGYHFLKNRRRLSIEHHTKS